ncbi:response regulator [Azospirillum cavernae]|uniref:Response regulator n=1 Tax=Azospirillum cavernae TaxID=2320860 RepID=A0A418W1C3_9PROT|nr:response regulator [Azospirillum cavernae]
MLKTDAQTGPCRSLRPSLSGRSLSVLLVEDEEASAAAVCAAVDKLGHRLCGTASSEAEAMAMVRQERPDVALMDVRLAGGDGIAVARRLHNDCGIRSIFLSGYADHGVMGRITESYPLGVVHKPFSAAQLKIVLDLAARRLR